MEKPIVLVIMDGVGKGDGGSGDAVTVAKTPTLDQLLANCPNTYLKAHGTAVGLPSDEDMGNSEVGKHSNEKILQERLSCGGFAFCRCSCRTSAQSIQCYDGAGPSVAGRDHRL